MADDDYTYVAFGLIIIFTMFIVAAIFGILCMTAWDHTTTTITIKDKFSGVNGLVVITSSDQVYNVQHNIDYSNLNIGKSYIINAAHNSFMNSLNNGTYNIDSIIKEV